MYFMARLSVFVLVGVCIPLELFDAEGCCYGIVAAYR